MKDTKEPADILSSSTKFPPADAILYYNTHLHTGAVGAHAGQTSGHAMTQLHDVVGRRTIEQGDHIDRIGQEGCARDVSRIAERLLQLHMGESPSAEQLP